MKLSVRFLTSSLSVLALTMAGVAQTNDPVAAAALASGTAGYGDVGPIDINQVSQVTITSDVVFDATTGLVENNAAGGQGPGPGSSARAVRSNTSTIDGMDGLVTFDGAFITQAGPSLGRLFRFTMMGNHPLVGGTTHIPAPIATVSLNLLNPDGALFATVPFAPFESLTLQSPNFNFINYRSGNQIQYTDAVHRAQFYNRMAPNWHTTLVPNIVVRVTFTIPKFVNVRANGNVVQTLGYASGTAPDGSRFVLMLDLLFNSLFSSGFINEINNGNFTADAMSSLMLPITFLYSFNANKPLTPGSCCVLVFHTYSRDLSAAPQLR